jgi:hypothetical protein
VGKGAARKRFLWCADLFGGLDPVVRRGKPFKSPPTQGSKHHTKNDGRMNASATKALWLLMGRRHLDLAHGVDGEIDSIINA